MTVALLVLAASAGLMGWATRRVVLANRASRIALRRRPLVQAEDNGGLIFFGLFGAALGAELLGLGTHLDVLWHWLVVAAAVVLPWAVQLTRHNRRVAG